MNKIVHTQTTAPSTLFKRARYNTTRCQAVHETMLQPAAQILSPSTVIIPVTDQIATTSSQQHQAVIQTVYELAALDSATAGILLLILKPFLSLVSLLMIVRIIMTWYPELDATQLPWSLAYTPTEPILAPTRKVIKPFNGLDVSPIVWVALISFVSEILTGPQGILNLIVRKGI